MSCLAFSSSDTRCIAANNVTYALPLDHIQRYTH